MDDEELPNEANSDTIWIIFEQITLEAIIRHYNISRHNLFLLFIHDLNFEYDIENDIIFQEDILQRYKELIPKFTTLMETDLFERELHQSLSTNYFEPLFTDLYKRRMELIRKILGIEISVIGISKIVHSGFSLVHILESLLGRVLYYSELSLEHSKESPNQDIEQSSAESDKYIKYDEEIQDIVTIIFDKVSYFDDDLYDNLKKEFREKFSGKYECHI